MTSEFVFDSFAVLAWMHGELGAEFVRGLMERVADGECGGAICAVNLGEVFYITARERGLAQAEAVHEELLELPWLVVPATDDLVWAAARLKAEHRISYGDAFALGCARQRQAALVTNDPELQRAAAGVAVVWQDN